MIFKKAGLFFIFSFLFVFNLFSQRVVSKDTHFKNLLIGIDSIEVFCIKNNDTTKYIICDKKYIEMFTGLVTGRKGRIKSATEEIRGYLIFYQKGSYKLKVDILNSGIRYKYRNGTIIGLSSYQADMLFMETCSPDGFDIME